ncbi:MAG TPA: hypothetical protein VD927_01785, partial [Chryseosolibacter sp.]|nr:hypothetical protein [Chryseosolibacter sp.]
MLNILLVSIAAPPKSDPESLQVGRYMKYLTQAGCSIELVTTANPTLYMEPDEALKKYNTAKKVHEHSLFEFRYLNAFINRYLPALNQYPDPKWSFRFFEIDQFSKPDIIYSRSYPISSTLLALKFKKQFNVPWILHLSDPWAFSYEGDSPATNFKTFPRRWNKKKESECFELADRISLTSVKTVDVYKKAYPKYAHKFLLTPNVFDEETISRSPVSFSDKLLILYTGGFGQKRSP